MNNELIKALEQIEREKGISKVILLEAIQDALVSALKRNFNNNQHLSISIDQNTGKVRVLAKKKIVAKVAEPQNEVLLKEAIKLHPGAKIDDFVDIESTPDNFGRIAAQTAKQVIVQRIREAERDLLFQEFVNRKGDIITGLIQRVEQNKVYVELGKIEGVIPSTEQVQNEKYRPGDRIKAYILDVKLATKGPQVILSRSHQDFLKRLFELEVPEIYENIVEIKSAAREPGYRSKIAVTSNQEGVDPVGSCVGARGNRVLSVVQELKGEKIDIVLWDKSPAVFIANALNPAKVVSVEINESDNSALVIVPDNQLSLAIGKEGQNARLAARLTGWKIDIKNKTLYDEEQERNRRIDNEINNIVENFTPINIISVEVFEKNKYFLLTVPFEDYMSGIEKLKTIVMDENFLDWSVKIQPPIQNEFPMEQVAEIFMKYLDPIPIISLELNKKEKKILIGISQKNIDETLDKQKENYGLSKFGEWDIIIESFPEVEITEEPVNDIIGFLADVIKPLEIISAEVDQDKLNIIIFVQNEDYEKASEKIKNADLPDFITNWNLDIKIFNVE